MRYRCEQICAVAVCLILTSIASVGAETEPGDQNQGGLAEIVVTAQKRSQSINDVPITITALDGDTLRDLGVSDPSDLTKVTPGLSYAKNTRGGPVYTLRGVGYYDDSMSAVPAVTIYVDEIPLPYSVLGAFTSLDVQRVEVVKGPQGTLYGENSTGGAVNYISNKPTDTFHAGADMSYGRFNDLDTAAFISGPLAENLLARFSINHESQFDGWQHSLTRPGDTLGKKNLTDARLLLEWQPESDLRMLLNINAGVDRSDTQAPQFQTIDPAQPYAYMIDSIYHPQYNSYPKTGNNAQNADWDAGQAFTKDNRQYQASLTVNYDPTRLFGITSITSYVRYDPDQLVDSDGTYLADLLFHVQGTITSIYDELRLHGSAFNDRLSWITGGNVERDQVLENAGAYIVDSYLGSATFGIDDNDSHSDLRTKTESGFANADYVLVGGLSAVGGVRYTSMQFTATSCSLALDAPTAAAFSFLDGTVVPVGGCFTVSPDGEPGFYTRSTSENNVSWRTGLSEKIDDNTLIYVTVNKGYKSGTYPNVNSATYLQDFFVKQEDVLDYEGGLKASLLDRKLQLNLAGFYYNYDNKQVLGSIYLPQIQNYVRAPVNIPQSRVVGSEFQLIMAPLDGLTLDFEATYVDSRITDTFVNIDILGVTKDLTGETLPFSPRWTAIARADYKWPLSAQLDAYAGALLHYQSKSNAGLGAEPLAELNSYTTLDLQAGIQTERLRVGLWGRNVTNKYYWDNVTMPIDTVDRYAAMPVTYGISLSYRY